MSENLTTDIICIGNATIDAFLQVHGENVHCRVDKETRELKIGLGEKILVDSSDFLLGGGASNVAVGLKRLGFQTSLIAEIGDDEFAQKIHTSLTDERVDVSQVMKAPSASSSFSIGLVFQGERTLFVRHVQRKHEFSFDNLLASWIYLGGLGREWESAYRNTVEFVKENTIKLAFAPGTTQIESGLDTIRHVIAASEMFFVNKEEAIEIVNSKLKIANREKMENLLRSLQELGPKIVIITDGENGSWAIDANGSVVFHKASENKAIERTGAGDAYASGFLAAIIYKKSIEEAMEWGTKNAGSVITKVGAQAGLLTAEELEKNRV